MQHSPSAGAPMATEASPDTGFETGIKPVSVTSESGWSVSQMLIRTASLHLKVDDIAKAYNDINDVARFSGGYIADSTLNAEETSSEAKVTLRVPSRGLDSAMLRIAALGKLLEQSITTEEVTEEYTDLTSRRRNLQREELRLLDFLKQAKKIPDLLQIEEEVSRIREQIETISGRLRYLENRVSFSTIEVLLQGPHFAKPAPKGPEWKALVVLRNAYTSLRNTGRTLATIGIWLGVYAPVWFPIGLATVWVVRRERKGIEDRE